VTRIRHAAPRSSRRRGARSSCRVFRRNWSTEVASGRPRELKDLVVAPDPAEDLEISAHIWRIGYDVHRVRSSSPHDLAARKTYRFGGSA
jgi:hypothetical protein